MNMSDRKLVYLDTNATTPLADEVLETIHSALRDAWGNASSSHCAGKKAKHLIGWSREKVAEMVHCEADGVFFTSGGTEANNWVFHSVLRYWQEEGVKDGRPHVIVTNLEHDSVANVATALQKQNLMDVTVVPARHSTAHVHAEDIEAALTPNTVLVSIMLANNETGVIQPIAEIADCIQRWSTRMSCQRPWLHTDAAQAIGKIEVDMASLAADYLTVVGHKFYGPRIGALCVRPKFNNAPLYPLLFGGGQERGLRPGTENTGMIAGLGRAAELVTANLSQYRETMALTCKHLRRRLVEEFGDAAQFNAYSEEIPHLPNTCNVSIVLPGCQGSAVLAKTRIVVASVGAACHSDRTEPSRVLLASGVSEKAAVHALRLSTGRQTTVADIDLAVQDLLQAVTLLRQHTPNGSGTT